MKLARAEITLASDTYQTLKEGKFSGISGVSFSSQQYLVTRQSPFSPWTIGWFVTWLGSPPPAFPISPENPHLPPTSTPRTQHTSPDTFRQWVFPHLCCTGPGNNCQRYHFFFFLSFNELSFTYNKNERSWIFHWWVLTWCSPKPRCRNPCYSPKAPLCPFLVNPHCFSEATTVWFLLLWMGFTGSWTLYKWHHVGFLAGGSGFFSSTCFWASHTELRDSKYPFMHCDFRKWIILTPFMNT